MSGKLGGPLVPPLYDLLMGFKANTMRDIRCCVPGSITSVDMTTGLVDVEVSLLQYDQKGVAFPYPILEGCHAITLQGGGIGVQMPIEAGDECLVFFADRCIDSWFQTGSPQPLPNPRMHDLSDGFVLVGLNSLVNPIITPMLAGEGGISALNTAVGAKIAINSSSQRVTISNGPSPANNLNGILQVLLTALAADPLLSPTTQAAILAAKVALATLLY